MKCTYCKKLVKGKFCTHCGRSLGRSQVGGFGYAFSYPGGVASFGDSKKPLNLDPLRDVMQGVYGVSNIEETEEGFDILCLMDDSRELAEFIEYWTWSSIIELARTVASRFQVVMRINVESLWVKLICTVR